jgi:superfamily II DNA or RNA helicase
MQCSDSYHAQIVDKLRYKILPQHATGKPEVICDVFRVKNVTSIPVGRSDLIPDGYEVNDLRVEVPADFKGLNPDVVFREDQQNAIDEINDNWIINAKPAWGKTFTSVGLAHKLGQKTLVVVHTVALRDQWLDEIRFILPNIEPGIIGTGLFNINSPIVVANVQTLNNKMGLVLEEFGTIIIDECHHIPATTFKKVLDKSKARFKLGLTATLGRRDKKHVMIPDYLSENIYYASDENSIKPRVIMMHTEIPLDSNPMTPWGVKINKLVENPDYKKLLVDVANIQYQKGHKVLVLSDRVEFLQDCNADTHHYTPAESDIIIGTTKDRKSVLKSLRDGEIDILWGSQKIFCEGISESSLSCLVMGQPINNIWLLEQICGRITRKHPGKLQPVIIDIVLAGATGKNQSTSRENFYINKGWEVEKI